MLVLVCLLAVAFYALARQRAEIIRLRVERRLSHRACGSWEAFRTSPEPTPEPPPTPTPGPGARA